jgi:hypothetical protein
MAPGMNRHSAEGPVRVVGVDTETRGPVLAIDIHKTPRPKLRRWSAPADTHLMPSLAALLTLLGVGIGPRQSSPATWTSNTSLVCPAQRASLRAAGRFAFLPATRSSR